MCNRIKNKITSHQLIEIKVVFLISKIMEVHAYPTRMESLYKKIHNLKKA